MSKENEIDNEKKKQEQNVADKDSANAQGADNTSEAKADKEEPKKEESAKDAEKKDSDDKTSKETELQKQVDDLKDRYLREVAEFDNYKKRTLKEKAELILNGGEKTITAILPVLDDLERALADKNEDAKAIKEGMDLIYKKFIKTLEGLGVKKIDTKDKDFDTDNMEAIAMVPGQSDDKKGKVIDCVQTGYTLNEKVIRHAKVAVGQ
ncbi:MAG: nucleotide exchange factor GrpE [Prevotella sp.]|uniref:nucleotide exchange factor GrpE n=1 Tax=Prevotella sp. TaxID=59823 RepID=UPI0025884FE4|nr:nucleotide exchange factor GrpE [Prevotella sp.]MDD6854208.1 nucleotide exchange factor GrpE [Prevotella sp.]